MHQNTKIVWRKADLFLFLPKRRFSTFPHRVPFNTCHFLLMFS